MLTVLIQQCCSDTSPKPSSAAAVHFFSLYCTLFIYLFCLCLPVLPTMTSPPPFFPLQLSGVNFPVVSSDTVSWFAEVEQINSDILQPDCGCCGSCPGQIFLFFFSISSTPEMTMTNGSYWNSHALYSPWKRKPHQDKFQLGINSVSFAYVSFLVTKGPINPPQKSKSCIKLMLLCVFTCSYYRLTGFTALCYCLRSTLSYFFLFFLLIYGFVSTANTVSALLFVCERKHFHC